MQQQELKVSPSLAAGCLLSLGEEIRKLEQSTADSIHFDVMDGHFVPLLTIGLPFLEQIRAITKMHLDVHIMLSNPDQVFNDYLNAGADTLTFHAEVALHAHRICSKIKERGCKAGIALNPATHWCQIEYLLPILDQVTIMSVNPGFSRQKHLDIVHPKIQQLSDFRKQHKLNFEIQVDGGVDTNNVAQLFIMGVNNVVAGGAVFNYKNYAEAVINIKKSALKKV